MKRLVTVPIAVLASVVAHASDVSPVLARANQVQAGPINPLPTIQIPVDFEIITNVRFDHGVSPDRVIGAVGKTIWQQPLGGSWTLLQNGWTGGQINGGAAIGSGFGISYTSVKAPWLVTFLISGGGDIVAGTKPGQYVAASIVGTLKF